MVSIMVSDRYIENYLAEKFPPKIEVDKRGKKRRAVWCDCSSSYEWREVLD